MAVKSLRELTMDGALLWELCQRRVISEQERDAKLGSLAGEAGIPRDMMFLVAEVKYCMYHMQLRRHGLE